MHGFAVLSVFGFELPIEVVVLGVLTGIAYALFGMGLTLTYQSSRVINFAQGAMGALPHLLLAWFVIDKGWGYWPALLITLAIGAGAGALVELGVIRRLAHAPRLVVLVATIGAAQLLSIPMAYIVNLNTSKMPQSPYPVPFDTSVTIGSLTLGPGQLLVLVVSPLLVVGLTFFLRRTMVGQASRAIAENEEAASLSGVPVRTISLVIWTIAGLLAATAAILNGPGRPIVTLGGGGGLNVAANGDLLLRGLGAAMIGGLVSLPQVFVAGVGLGMVEALVRWNYPTGGLVDFVIMAIIVTSLLARRDLRRLSRGAEESSWSLSGGVRELPARIRNHPRVRAARRAGIALVLAVAVVVPLFADSPQQLLFSAIALFVVIALSLVILTGWAGQVSLGHFAFVALGALVGGRMQQLGFPPWGALLWVATAGCLVAVVVGLPALRIKGLFLAVTTLAFAVITDTWVLQQDWLVHMSGSSSSMSIGRRHWLGIDFQEEQSYYFLCLALVLVTAAMVAHLRRTGVARAILAVRDNEAAAASLSIAPASTKLIAFVLSGTMASVAGYFYGMLLVSFRTAGLTAPTLSTLLVTMVIFGGATTVTGAVLGALYVRGIPYFIHSPSAVLLASGAGLLLVLLLIPGGLASLAFRARDWIAVRLAGGDGDANDATGELAHPPRLSTRTRRPAGPDDPWPLEVRDIAVHFGGVRAVDGVSLHLRQGEILGLMGPNGAGKTTLFDILSGHVSPDHGAVLLYGDDVTSLPAHERARIGLGRSFQQARLFDDLTVIEAFELALEREEPSELIPSLLGAPPARAAERRKELRAGELVDLLGLRPFAERKAIELTTGTRRIAELGTVVALGADVILLDEPTGGIAQAEVPAFISVLRQIRDHLDASMVIVAHDIPMITAIADRIYVLSTGQVIAEGTPDVLHDDEAVVAAYFGTADEEEIESAIEGAPAGRARRDRRGVTTG